MKKNNLPVQGKAILRGGTTTYFREEMATYFSDRDINRDVISRDIASQISCQKANKALGINAYCSGNIANSLFNY